MEHALAQKACVDTAVEGSSTLGVQSFDIKVGAHIKAQRLLHSAAPATSLHVCP